MRRLLAASEPWFVQLQGCTDFVATGEQYRGTLDLLVHQLSSAVRACEREMTFPELDGVLHLGLFLTATLSGKFDPYHPEIDRCGYLYILANKGVILRWFKNTESFAARLKT